MDKIPSAVLSERFHEVMEGRRLKTAVFLTFRFDPGFFESEVLPEFLNVALAPVPKVRLLQIETALQAQTDFLAVYYDQKGLLDGGAPPKLDVRYVPIRLRTGAVFHPKNVLLLVEDEEAGEDGSREEHLIVASMSANLTRSGWWDNVECAHIEEVNRNDKCGFREDLLELISRIKALAPEGTDHGALERIRDYILKNSESRGQLTWGQVMHTQFYWGRESVPDFLEANLRDSATGENLEIISPYFDNTETAGPLKKLIERFHPAEVRIFLPRGKDGDALCAKEYFQTVKKLANVYWAHLPAELLKAGAGDAAGARFVHAKVYRFFGRNQRYERIFIGSANLTNAAHAKGGNFETGFLVDTDPDRVPDWWLARDTQPPASFTRQEEGSDAEVKGTTDLFLRFHWNSGVAEAFWDNDDRSPALQIRASGSPLMTIEPLRPRVWMELPVADAAALRRILDSTSFVKVVSEAGEAVILVQEDGMAQKPSLFSSLSAVEILRYWALLTPDQRAAFIEERGREIGGAIADLGYDPLPPLKSEGKSLFDTFAGIFHAFGSLERCVQKAIEEGREKEAECRLVGQHYDSLPKLLDRVLVEEKNSDRVSRYIMLLCAKQLLAKARDSHPDFWREHKQEFVAIEERLRSVDRVRAEFDFDSVERKQQFFDWFDTWFLKRAESASVIR